MTKEQKFAVADAAYEALPDKRVLHFRQIVPWEGDFDAWGVHLRQTVPDEMREEALTLAVALQDEEASVEDRWRLGIVKVSELFSEPHTWPRLAGVIDTLVHACTGPAIHQTLLPLLSNLHYTDWFMQAREWRANTLTRLKVPRKARDF